MPTNAKRERRRMTRERMCKRKKNFAWKDEAVRYMQERDGNADGADRLEVFNCLYCGHWHVGHTPKREGGHVDVQTGT